MELRDKTKWGLAFLGAAAGFFGVGLAAGFGALPIAAGSDLIWAGLAAVVGGVAGKNTDNLVNVAKGVVIATAGIAAAGALHLATGGVSIFIAAPVFLSGAAVGYGTTKLVGAVFDAITSKKAYQPDKEYTTEVTEKLKRNAREMQLADKQPKAGEKPIVGDHTAALAERGEQTGPTKGSRTP